LRLVTYIQLLSRAAYLPNRYATLFMLKMQTLFFPIIIWLILIPKDNGIAQEACDYSQIIQESFNFKPITFGNVITASEENQIAIQGENIGTIAPFPESFSEGYDQQINISKSLYQEGRYLLAYQVLKPALKSEPSNPFILNEAARAAYWVDTLKQESFDLYEELITILDSEGLNEVEENSIYINVWFTEAYWKLGTLHMDYENYPAAIYEIQRALVAMYGRSSPQISEQFYSFLAKAYYKIDKHSKARCFSEMTLELNPNNEFVLPYLK